MNSFHASQFSIPHFASAIVGNMGAALDHDFNVPDSITDSENMTLNTTMDHRCSVESYPPDKVGEKPELLNTAIEGVGEEHRLDSRSEVQVDV